MISLDVTSLYTSIPHRAVINTLHKHWNELSIHTNLTKDLFLQGIKIILENGYFEFASTPNQSKIFRQKSGLAMGSPLSSILSDLVMDGIIDKIQESHPRPFLILRYVDDLFLIIHENATQKTLENANSIDHNIQFTIEIETASRTINFLDTTITRNQDNTIKTKWYHKPLSTYPRLTNYNTSSNPTIIRNIANNTFLRAISLTHPTLQAESIEKAVSILTANNYPKTIIQKAQIFAQNKVNATQNNPTQTNNPNTEPTSYTSFPFTDINTNSQIKRIVTNYAPNLKIANYTINKASDILTHTKTKYPPLQRIDLVYKIPCSSCDLSYVGTTKKTLETRINQHRYSLKTDKVTGITKHYQDTGHIPNFIEASPIHFESNYHRRFVAENIHILTNDTINLTGDVTLHNSYSSLIRKIHTEPANQLQDPNRTQHPT